MKLARPAKRPCASCSDCCRMAISGPARNASMASATTISTACAMRSLQCTCWRTGAIFSTALIAVGALLEDTHPLGHHAQRQAAADLELGLCEIVEREVDGELVLRQHRAADAHQAIRAHELDLLDLGVEHVGVTR